MPLPSNRSRQNEAGEKACVDLEEQQSQDTSLPIFTEPKRRGRRLLAEAERRPTWFFHLDLMHYSSPLRGSSSPRIECRVHCVDCSSFETSLSLGFWSNDVQFA
ncbi:hypothetical protein C4D60_Mb07t28180 [Musa balbisiana]|uniref:Uncharacterized protein n=1 Tax=Musa balbisiana TaxID=52838 RepID=A0A4V4H6Z9_MUSBA|nr:hypothetical protein C4D60_Mb07t28180 [Musa balbisiana]